MPKYYTAKTNRTNKGKGSGKFDSLPAELILQPVGAQNFQAAYTSFIQYTFTHSHPIRPLIQPPDGEISLAEPIRGRVSTDYCSCTNDVGSWQENLARLSYAALAHLVEHRTRNP